MDFKKLEKAQKIYLEVKEIDKQIGEIEKVAQIVASGGEAEFIFRATELKSTEKKKVLDSDGSLIIEDHSPRISFHLSSVFGDYSRPVMVETPKNQLQEKLEESQAMLLLGVLIEAKHNKRRALLDKLQNLGVNI